MARANPKWAQIRQDGGHVGTKLALFSVLSASWAHFSRLAGFVAPFGRFFRDLGRSSLDFQAQVGYMLSGLATFF